VVLFNIVITLAEYIGGIMSGSLALISDAGHNLSDVLSLILGYAGEKVSKRKATKKFSFGLKRFEVLIALVNSLFLLLVGLYIVYEAVQRFRSPQPINPTIMLPIAVIGLIGNVLSIFVLNKDRNHSLNMRAAFLHLFYDAISSVAVIIVGLILLFTNLYWLDLAVSIVIVIMIVWSSLNIINESLHVFLQGTPKNIDQQAICQALESTKNVASIHGLHIWSISSCEVFLSCHLSLKEDSNETGDEVIIDVNKMLHDRFGIEHTTLQVEHSPICDLEGSNCCR